MHKLVLDLKNCSWYWKKTSRKYLLGLTPTILLLLHSPKRRSLGDNLLTLADSFPVMALSVVDRIASAQCHGDCATDMDPNWIVRGIGTIEFEVHPTVDTSICKSKMCNNLPYVATQGMSLSSFEILTYTYTTNLVWLRCRYLLHEMMMNFTVLQTSHRKLSLFLLQYIGLVLYPYTTLTIPLDLWNPVTVFCPPMPFNNCKGEMSSVPF